MMSPLDKLDMLPADMDFGRDYLADDGLAGDLLDQTSNKTGLMRHLHEQMKLVASTKSTVLITGETGTGKSYMASLIHRHSPYKSGPFINVHCGAIPETLIESELFGHEKGAFTGAVKRKQGRFSLASGGTIFLDEIGTVTSAIQIKLLQFLHDRTFQPVGSEETVEADVRVLAATNSNLKKMVDDGHFRSDLYYRLNVFPLHIPPLRERREEILSLAGLFINRLNRLYRRRITGVTKDVEQAFHAYDWPGNIRELENLIERAFILEKEIRLGPKSFPPELFSQECMPPLLNSEKLPALREFRAEAVRQAELQYLVSLLKKNRGRIDQCATTAGITTRQLHKLMTKHGLRKENFK
jgi:transcriptional regulator with GAF, ATPase, and Fis domain